MNRRIFICLLVLVCILVAFNLLSIISVSAAKFAVGDYVQLGSIDGEPILWKAIEVDGNALLISEDILSVMQFDDTNGRWSESSLRTWLNSTEEGGFLSEDYFTEEELGFMTDTDYSVVLNDNHTEDADTGGQVQLFSSFLTDCAIDYNLSYKENLTDKVFIPSLYDIATLSGNPYLYGVDFAMATIAVGEFPRGEYYGYWLRDSMYGTEDTNVRCVTSDGYVSYNIATDNTMGVRPMCSVNTVDVGIHSGDGSADNPYVLSNSDYVDVSFANDTVWAGHDAKVIITGKGLSNYSLKLYHNGNIVTEDGGMETTVKAYSGINIINVIACDEDGCEVFSSQPAVFTGVDYEKYAKISECDFDGELPTEYQEKGEWSASAGKSGKGMKLSSKDRTTQMMGISLSYYRKQIYFEADIRFDTMYVVDKIPFQIKIMPSDTFLKPIIIDKYGNLKFDGFTNTVSSSKVLEEGRWYNFKIVMDIENDTITISLDDEIVCHSAKSTTEFDYIPYLNVSASWNSSSDENSLCIDNIRTYVLSPGEGEITFGLIQRRYNIEYLFVNNTSSTWDIDVVLGEYANDYSALLNVNSIPVSTNAHSFISGEIVSAENINPDSKYKSFVWESLDSLHPVCISSEAR